MKKNYQLQIIALWTVFLLGTLFHDLTVATSHAHSTGEISSVLWGMLAFFTIPMVAIALTAFTEAMTFRKGHFWLTVLYSVLNLAHAAADLFVPPRVWPQIVLMVFLFAIGLLLNRVSWQWMRDRRYL
jgi:hypothetical protein